MVIGLNSQLIEHMQRLNDSLDHMSRQMSELERRMLATEGHLSSFFISQNRQSIEIERITRRLDGIEKKLAPSGS